MSADGAALHVHTTGAGSEGVLLRREGQSQGENALNALCYAFFIAAGTALLQGYI